MLSGILKRVMGRLIASVPALAGVIVVTFILMRVLPGDPAVFFASGPSAGQAEIAEVRHSMGLDRPIYVQLALYLGQLATGNLGPLDDHGTTGHPGHGAPSASLVGADLHRPVLSHFCSPSRSASQPRCAPTGYSTTPSACSARWVSACPLSSPGCC